ncbi:MAG TPA: hypothetical protein VMW95_05165 [Desulfobacterales bacterium]|nr:hypothetical protein [Desulfobacterales bacterium]
MDLLEELKKLTAKFDQVGIDYALCGGLALAIYARPRATLGIDILIEFESLSKAEDAATALGFTIRAAPMEFQNGKVKINRLTKIDKDTGEALVLDLLIVTQAIRNAWESRHTVEWDEGPLKVVSPEGLIFLKSLRRSGQDKDDIEYLRSITYED